MSKRNKSAMTFDDQVAILKRFMMEHFHQMRAAMLAVPRTYMAEHDPFYKFAHKLGKGRQLMVVARPKPYELDCIASSKLPIDPKLSADEFCVLMAAIYVSQKMTKLTDLALFACDESQHGQTFYHEDGDELADFHFMDSICSHSMPVETERVQ